MIKRVLIGLAILVAGALSVAIYRFNLAGDGSALTGQTRADFTRSTVEGCVGRQKAAAGDEGLDPAVIDRFCACYADDLAKRVTTADLDRLVGRPPADIQAEMRARMEEADRVCLAALDKP